MAKTFLLLFVMFVSSQGFLLDGNTKTATSGPPLDEKRYKTLMDVLIVERRSRSKLETAVTQELLALRQEIAKCQCGNGNVGTTQTINKGSLTNDTNALKEEIIHLKRDQALLQTQVAGLMQNNTVLKDTVILLERNLTILQNTQCDLDIRNETSHLEKALQITDNKLNAVINNANARKQDFIALFQKVTGLNQNHTVLKNNVIQLERNFTMGNTKCYLSFRNETSQLVKALQITNNKVNAAINDANARKQDFLALLQRIQSTEQRLENSTRSLEASQNMTFLKLQTEIINGAKLAEQNLSDRTKLLEMRDNSTSLKLQQQTVLLQQELTKMSNRVTLKTCVGSEGDTNGVIKFTDVRIADGIHNTDLIRNSGIFTCENPGLYLISVYIVTHTKHGRYYVLKNGAAIADGFSSLTDYYETTSVTVIEHLTVNDKISITVNMYVFNDYESCLTILQIK